MFFGGLSVFFYLLFANVMDYSYLCHQNADK